LRVRLAEAAGAGAEPARTGAPEAGGTGVAKIFGKFSEGADRADIVLEFPYRE